jgi:ABC-type Zn uptake system ZnuABC Zn-binding protein ZnuA
MDRSPLPGRVALAAAVVTLATLGACGGNGDDDGRLRVLATVSPITSIVENVGGTRIRLEGLVPEGVNSHTYEPPVSVARAIARADLIVLNGLQLEEPILELAQANKKSGATVLLLGDKTITPEQYKYDFSFPREEGKPNPHLWPDPLLALRYAELVHAELVRLDPANRAYYDTNLAALRPRLQELDKAIREAVQTVPPANRKLLTYHDSWAYFADRYGMTVIGAVQPSDFSEPSAREVARLIDQIKAERVPAVFGSEVFPSPVLQQIARETGAQFVDKLRDDDLPGKPGDALHSYLGLMVENMRAMIPALGGSAASLDRVATGPVFSDGPSGAKYPQ